RLCAHHHYLRTHKGFELTGGPGRWRWVTPAERHADTDTDSDTDSTDTRDGVSRDAGRSKAADGTGTDTGHDPP
ncbi:MAG: hypothetical protein ACYCV7_14650, partial [Acidimicrobiales bacterium]